MFLSCKPAIFIFFNKGYLPCQRILKFYSIMASVTSPSLVTVKQINCIVHKLFVMTKRWSFRYPIFLYVPLSPLSLSISLSLSLSYSISPSLALSHHICSTQEKTTKHMDSSFSDQPCVLLHLATLVQLLIQTFGTLLSPRLVSVSSFSTTVSTHRQSHTDSHTDRQTDTYTHTIQLQRQKCLRANILCVPR